MDPERIATASEGMIGKGRDTYETRLAAGQARLKMKQYPEAIEHLSRATEHQPSQTMAWQELGKALKGQDDTKAAEQAWQQALQLARQNGDKQAEKILQVWLKRLAKG